MGQEFRRRSVSLRAGGEPQDARRVLPLRTRAGRHRAQADARRSVSERGEGECEGVSLMGNGFVAPENRGGTMDRRSIVSYSVVLGLALLPTAVLAQQKSLKE